jgi:hypothetical protein
MNRTSLPIVTSDRNGALPLSLQQEHIWSAPESATHIIPPLAVRLRGDLDVHALERAVNDVVKRHDSLRMCFGSRQGGQPHQRVCHALTIRLSYDDVSRHAVETREGTVRSIVAESGRRPFNLAELPLIRAGVARIAPDDHVFWIAVHHIVCDLWSMKILMREIAHFYSAAAGGRPSALPQAAQYGSYVRWQRRWITAVTMRQELRWWREQINGAAPVRLRTSAFPTDGRHGGDVVWMDVPPRVTAAIRTTARAMRATDFMLLFAAFQVFVCKYAGTTEFVVDSLIANRDRPEFASTVGMFAATIPLRTDLGGNPDTQELLARTRERCLGAYQHQHLPFWRASARASEAPAAIIRPAVLFALQHAPASPPVFHGLALDAFEDSGFMLFEHTGVRRPGWPQVWHVWDRGPQFRIVVTYQADQFTRAAMTDTASTFLAVMDSVSARPGRRVLDT